MRREPFEYALLRVVPDLERGERLNVGVIVFCRPRRFLDARMDLEEALLAALAPDCDPEPIRAHLDVIARLCAGDATAGPVAGLGQPERFRWLVAPSSTVLQPGPVHAGLTEDPAATLEHLFLRLVRRDRTPTPSLGETRSATDL